MALPCFGFFSIAYDDKEIKITEQMLRVNWWAEADKASFTKGKNLYQRAQELIESWGEESFQTAFPELWPIILKVQEELDKPANDGTVKFDPDRRGGPKFWVEGQKPGRELDVERLCAEIVGALGRREPKRIMAITREVEPCDPDELLERIHLRSQFTTSFIDNAPRESNIALALEAFDGLVVQAGERVSFNDVVGKRTRARGYQSAKIIMDGEFVDGVGGGVCQASTTLFNAVLRSGLKIVRSYNHSLPISYVPLGLDAMVSSQSDLEFQNNTGDTIYIEAKVIDKGPRNNAVVKIYGPSTNGLEFRPRSEISEGQLAQEVSGPLPTIDEAMFYDEIVVSHGYPPRSAVTYLDTYKNGELVESKLIRKSKYKGKPRVVKYQRRSLHNIVS